MLLNIILIIIGFILLIKGADILVKGSSDIAHKFHIPTIIIGLTVVAIGTSMPELVVSSSSALKGHSDIAVGNVIGSNLSNLLLILGTCAIIRPLKFKHESKYIDNPLTLILTIILFIMCLTNTLVSRNEGIILLLGCLSFMIYNCIMAKKNMDGYKHPVKKISMSKSLLYIGLGIIGLKYGGDFVVDNSVEIAEILGVSEKIISLTIISISTSLPELITSITATRRDETDMAIGNILGSQILNILLILGVTSVLCPINYSIEYNNDFIFLIVVTLLMFLYPFIGKKNHMTRNNGIIFVFMYITYMIYLIISNI